jgi:KDO2-lipid IV(A) lauroyltransferase
MDTVLYFFARAVLLVVQLLPLTWVAWLGRKAGGLVWRLDKRHRRVAERNLAQCFGEEKTPVEILELARENFRRIGESFACGIKTAGMYHEDLRERVEFIVPPAFQLPPGGGKPQSLVVAIGHFGNFELYARFGQFTRAFQCATTYRGLRQASLTRLLQALRERSGCYYFERRTDGAALRAFMNQPGVMLGLLADQHAGDSGLWLPFFGRECSTSASPAVFALRYHCPLYLGICYRVGLGRWRIEAGPEIATHKDGQPRTSEEIMLDVNRAYEAAIRRDPANWFWVHNRWKERKGQRLKAKGQSAEAPEGNRGSSDGAGGDNPPASNA